MSQHINIKGRKLQILHLEDVSTDAELVQMALKKGGFPFEMHVVAHEKEFIDALKMRPDVILSDHSLPSFNSHEALKIVRQTGLKVPFILITATVSEEYAVKMIKEGADDYILKDRLERLPGSVLHALEMRKMEREHSAYLKAVLASEAILKEAERLAQLGSWNINFENKTSTWSDETFRILGYFPGEVDASLDNFLKHVHHTDYEHVKELMDDAIHILPSIKMEFRVLDKLANEKHIFCQLVIKRNSNNEVKEISGFVQDITQRKNAQAEIIKLNELLEKKVEERTAQLEEANRELEAFSYSVSHDLVSPLRSQLGFSQILLKRYSDKLDDEGKEYLEFISKNAHYMKRLIEELLNLSRTDRATINPEVVNMNEQVNLVLNNILARETVVNADINVPLLPNAFCDPVLIQQVWVNLISNAVKYSSHEEHPKIEVGSKGVNGSITYYVKDNGVGFDMKESGKLFEVFQRLHDQSEFEGTGVGLALVKRIINKHGGKVWAEAETGNGATFYFSLPNHGN